MINIFKYIKEKKNTRLEMERRLSNRKMEIDHFWGRYMQTRLREVDCELNYLENYPSLYPIYSYEEFNFGGYSKFDLMQIHLLEEYYTHGYAGKYPDKDDVIFEYIKNNMIWSYAEGDDWKSDLIEKLANPVANQLLRIIKKDYENAYTRDLENMNKLNTKLQTKCY